MTSAELRAAEHLALALEAHRVKVGNAGGAVPEVLVFWESMARFSVRRGQAGSSFGDPCEWSDPEDMPRLLTYKAAAASLGVSESTVTRLIAADELRRVRIGHASRIAVEDLDDYVARLRASDDTEESA